MATWYYYNESGERIGPLRGRELKKLVQQGQVTPETKVEDGKGLTALAKQVTGLTFTETAQIPAAQTPAADLGEEEFERFRVDVASPQSIQGQQTSSVPSPPSGVNPLSAPVPETPIVGVNPFASPLPPVQPAVPILPRNRRTFAEIVSWMMRATMNCIASTVGMILALVLAVVVVLLICCLLEMAHLAPRVLPYNPFVMPSPYTMVVLDNHDAVPTVKRDNLEQPMELSMERPMLPPTLGVPAHNNNDAIRRAELQRRRELIDRAVDIDRELNNAGFRDNNATANLVHLANFGTSALQTDFNDALGVWIRATSSERTRGERARAEAYLEGIRTKIGNHMRERITPQVYFRVYPYQVSNSDFGGNEGRFTMTIDTGFEPLRFGSLETGDPEIALLLPQQGITATVAEFRRESHGFIASRIGLNIRGNSGNIRSMFENRNDYRVKVYFTDLRSRDVPAPIILSSGLPRNTYPLEPISAEILRIEIIPNR